MARPIDRTIRCPRCNGTGRLDGKEVDLERLRRTIETMSTADIEAVAMLAETLLRKPEYAKKRKDDA